MREAERDCFAAISVSKSGRDVLNFVGVDWARD